jgi:TolB-like protein
MARLFAVTMCCVLALSGNAAAATRTAPPKRQKLAVLPLATSGLTPEAASALNGFVVNAIAQIDRFDVVTESDLKAMVGLQEMKYALGCTDVAACIAEIGGAVGADRLLSGTVTVLGEDLVLSTSLIDSRRQMVIARGQARVKNDPALYGRAADDAVYALFGLEAPKSDPNAAQKDDKPWRRHGLTPAQWQQYLTYRRLAERAGVAARTPERWLQEVLPQETAWLGYLQYLPAARAATVEPLDFDAYRAQILPRHKLWIAYFDYCGVQLDRAGKPLSFEAWLSNVKLGRVAVSSTPPGARVLLEKELLGLTPLTIKGRAAGTYELRLELEGYAPFATSITIADEQETTERFTLLSVAQERAHAATRRGWIAATVTTGVVAVGAAVAAAALFALAPTKSAIDSSYAAYAQAPTADSAASSYAMVQSQVARHNSLIIDGAVLAGVAGAAAVTALALAATLPKHPTATPTVVPLASGGAAAGVFGCFP